MKRAIRTEKDHCGAQLFPCEMKKRKKKRRRSKEEGELAIEMK